MSIQSFERKLSALSNAVSSKVVRRIGRELFDLKARGDIFFNHPVYTGCPISSFSPLMCQEKEGKFYLMAFFYHPMCSSENV